MPEEGWGDDTPIPRFKKRRKDIASRRCNQFSSWTAITAPFQPAHVGLASFAPAEEDRECEASTAPYSEPTKRLREPETPQVTLCLPILSVSVTATVDGTVARTELLQRFHNPSDITIDAAKHVFPLYDGAVITSFECTIGDERRVRGVVKPKVQARKEFDEAVRDKVAAPALLEEHTPEIFETSLGSIPTDTTVEIKITYVQELKVVMMKLEATEGIALTIPMSIAPRYSKAPIEWEPASKVPEERLDLWIRVIDNGKVNHKGCDEESGHLLQFEGSKPVEYSDFQENDASSRTYYVWHHLSESPVLRKDFVFVIQMNEGHHIKSRAIACPADDNGLTAMMVNIRPNDLFQNAIVPQSFTGEILFLLDQSGSMGWTNGSSDYGRRHIGARKIDVMREAMLLALSGIPSTCVFNVISWGSATMGLWETSRPHTQESIREAKDYVSQVEADMGGTDLLRALESVVKRRVQDRGSTQIIILTDGELEPEDSIQFIWKKRQLLGDNIRFFALGIGDEVSHRLVESIAEYGGGYSDVVHTTHTPRWHNRLNRLLKSALEPNSWSCDIDLGGQFERKGLINFKLRDENGLENGKTPYIQAPFPISSLHPFSFGSISLLIDLRHSGDLPKTVTISTTTTGAKKKTYELPIEASSASDGTINRLVAKSVLLSLQDDIKRGTAESIIAKENAENIGATYSITSKWTSFVAVSENQPAQTVEEQKMKHYKALFDEIDIDEFLKNSTDDESSSSGVPNHTGHGIPNSNSLESPPDIGLLSMPQPCVSQPELLSSEPGVPLEVESLERTRADTEDDSLLDSPLRHCKYAEPPVKKKRGRPTLIGKGRPQNSSVHHQRHHPLVCTPREITLRKTTRNPPVFSSYQNAPFSHSSPKPPPPSGLDLPVPAQQRVTQDNIPSVPEFPAYRAPATQIPPPPRPSGAMSATYIPLGDTYSVPHSTAPILGTSPVRAISSSKKTFEVPPGAPLRNPSKGQFDLDHEDGSRSSFESTSPQHESHGPLNWLVAMECQDGQGLFELTDQARGTLRLHFCQGTDDKIGPEILKLLGSSSAQDQEYENISARLLDTLMMVECYKTHCAQEEDIWDLMMERAWDTVLSALGLSEEEEALYQLAGQLRGAMMHAHYVAATGVKDSEKDEDATGTTECPACDVIWRTTRQFFCPFDHESDGVDEFSRWDDFWRHQVNEGHVVCAQEVIYE